MAKHTIRHKRPRATLLQKVHILDYLHTHKCSQAGVVERFKDIVSISKSSLNEWLKNENQFRETLKESEMGGRQKRRSKFKYEKINRKMDELVQKNPAISEPELRVHWCKYAREYGVEDPKRLEGFSHGWLEQFKKRHNLIRRGAQGKDDGSGSGSAGLGDPALGRAGLGNNDTGLGSAELKSSRLGNTTSRLGRDNIALELDFDQFTGFGQDLKRRRYSPEKPQVSKRRNPIHGRTKEFQPQKSLSFTPFVDPYDDRAGLRINSLLSRENLRENESEASEYREGEGRSEYREEDPNPVGSEVLVQPVIGPMASAQEMERFFFFRADHFFKRHHYDYPQTIKLYEDFKTSFLSEKLISLRAEDPGIPVPGSVQAAKEDYGSDIVPGFMDSARSHTGVDDDIKTGQKERPESQEIGKDKVGKGTIGQIEQIGIGPTGPTGGIGQIGIGQIGQIGQKTVKAQKFVPNAHSNRKLTLKSLWEQNKNTFS